MFYCGRYHPAVAGTSGNICLLCLADGIFVCFSFGCVIANFRKMPFSLARGSLVDLFGRLDSLNQFAIISQC